MKQKNQRGLTVMGLVLIIAAIGGAAFFIVPRLMNGGIGVTDERASRRANDTTRISHLKQFQSAVEVYFTQHGDYPETNNMWVDIMETTEPCKSLLAADLIDTCFSDPGDEHQYRYRSNGTTYAIQATLAESGAFCNLNTRGDCVRTVTESRKPPLPEELE